MKPFTMRIGLTMLVAVVLASLLFGQARASAQISVVITSPAEGSAVPPSSSVLVIAAVSRATMISQSFKVTIYENLRALTNTTVSGSWQVTDYSNMLKVVQTHWTSPSVSTQVLTSTLTAYVEDNAGNSDMSLPVKVYVDTPPTVRIVSPLTNQVFFLRTNVLIQVEANDVDGSVTNVQFFAGTNLLGADALEPFEFLWTNQTSGPHRLTARAFDNLGVATDSAAVYITNNAVPAVSIVSPTNGTVFPQQNIVSITAQASDPDGSVTNLAFFANGLLIGRTISTPYTLNWTNVTQGDYDLTALATDNRGESTTSAPPVRITVLNAAPW